MKERAVVLEAIFIDETSPKLPLQLLTSESVPLVWAWWAEPDTGLAWCVLRDL